MPGARALIRQVNDMESQDREFTNRKIPFVVLREGERIELTADFNPMRVDPKGPKGEEQGTDGGKRLE